MAQLAMLPLRALAAIKAIPAITKASMNVSSIAIRAWT